ncbi:oligosaccharide flippase family protein [Georgenia daeguensis]|uniref:Oligosaccharide flippase family protein n=1 Tax=Georgenia daeguensis TaxID=908355 RepID=A0ABP8ETZ7_9MICO
MTAPAAGPPLDRRQLQARAVDGALWTMVHVAVSLPLAFLANLVIARVLGVVDYGRLSFLTALMDIATGVVGLGVGTALVQYGARAHAAGRRAEVRDLLAKTQGFRLLVAAPLLAVLVVLVADVDPVLLVLAVVFGLVVPAGLSGAPAALTIESRTASGARVAMLGNVLTLGAALTAVLALRSPDATWAARLVMGGVVTAIALVPVSRDYRLTALRPRLPRGLPAGFWRFAVPAGLSGIVANLVTSRSEIFLLQWLADPVAVGTFALAFGLSSHLFSPAQALIGPLIPAVSGLSEVDRAALGAAFSRTLRVSSTVVALLLAGALPALAALVPLLYGADYSDVPGLLVALGVAGGLMVVAAPVQAFVLARLRGGRLLTINLAALGVDLAVAVALIPGLGVWGAVAANVVGAATRLALLVRGEIGLLGLTGRQVARCAAPALAGAAVCVAVSLAGSAGPLPALGTAAATGTLGVVLLLLVLRVTRTGLEPGDAAAVVGAVPLRVRGVASRAIRLLVRHGR